MVCTETGPPFAEGALPASILQNFFRSHVRVDPCPPVLKTRGPVRIPFRPGPKRMLPAALAFDLPRARPFGLGVGR